MSLQRGLGPHGSAWAGVDLLIIGLRYEDGDTGQQSSSARKTAEAITEQLPGVAGQGASLIPNPQVIGE